MKVKGSAKVMASKDASDISVRQAISVGFFRTSLVGNSATQVLSQRLKICTIGSWKKTVIHHVFGGDSFTVEKTNV